METWSLLFEIVVLLGAALVLGAFFSRLGQSPLVGYLIAGMLLGGPGSLQFVKSERDIEVISELGVSLLLFGLGLEFSFARLRRRYGRALVGGVLQVLLTWLLAALVCLAFGLGTAEAVAVGAMIALSSTAVVLRILMERAAVDSGHGRSAVAVLLVQDMAVVPIAVLLGLLASGGGVGEAAASVGRILGLTAALIVVLYLVLNKGAVAVLGTLSLQRNRELVVLLAVVTGLGAAFAAHAVGISPALGAFLAGMCLGASPFATQIRADIASLRIILLTLFFGAAGMVADPLWILANAHLVLGVLALVILGKTALVWAVFRGLGVPAAVAAATGLCLAQMGEFAFVLGEIAKSGGVISADTHLLVVSVTIVSLFISPLLVPNAAPIGAWLAARLGGRAVAAGWQEEEPGTGPPEVVIIGFGPAGQVAAQPLVERAERVLVVDLNQRLLEEARQLGFDVQVGDATQLEVLEHARVVSARMVVVTVPHHQTALTILRHIRRLAPAAHCVVRSRYQVHTHELSNAGAHTVLGDEEEIGSKLGRHIAGWIDSGRAEPDPPGED